MTTVTKSVQVSENTGKISAAIDTVVIRRRMTPVSSVGDLHIVRCWTTPCGMMYAPSGRYSLTQDLKMKLEYTISANCANSITIIIYNINN